MFFTFGQNNSGGGFHGPEYVIVEAPDAETANARAEQLAGVYFDGVCAGLDCQCCGDRWERVSNFDGQEEPLIYGEPPADGQSYIIVRMEAEPKVET